MAATQPRENGRHKRPYELVLLSDDLQHPASGLASSSHQKMSSNPSSPLSLSQTSAPSSGRGTVGSLNNALDLETKSPASLAIRAPMLHGVLSAATLKRKAPGEGISMAITALPAIRPAPLPSSTTTWPSPGFATSIAPRYHRSRLLVTSVAVAPAARSILREDYNCLLSPDVVDASTSRNPSVLRAPTATDSSASQANTTFPSTLSGRRQRPSTLRGAFAHAQPSVLQEGLLQVDHLSLAPSRLASTSHSAGCTEKSIPGDDLSSSNNAPPQIIQASEAINPTQLSADAVLKYCPIDVSATVPALQTACRHFQSVCTTLKAEANAREKVIADLEKQISHLNSELKAKDSALEQQTIAHSAQQKDQQANHQVIVMGKDNERHKLMDTIQELTKRPNRVVEVGTTPEKTRSTISLGYKR